MAGLLSLLLVAAVVPAVVPTVVDFGAGVEVGGGRPIVAEPQRPLNLGDQQSWRVVLMPQRGSPSTRGGKLSPSWQAVSSSPGFEPKREEKGGKKPRRHWSRRKKALVACFALALLAGIALFLRRENEKVEFYDDPPSFSRTTTSKKTKTGRRPVNDNDLVVAVSRNRVMMPVFDNSEDRDRAMHGMVREVANDPTKYYLVLQERSVRRGAMSMSALRDPSLTGVGFGVPPPGLSSEPSEPPPSYREATRGVPNLP